MFFGAAKIFNHILQDIFSIFSFVSLFVPDIVIIAKSYIIANMIEVTINTKWTTLGLFNRNKPATLVNDVTQVVE